MSALTFQAKARKRPSAAGGTIREWRSADGRYIIVEITNPAYGRWYRACRVLNSGVTFASESRHKTRAAAERACKHHREA